MAPPSVLVTGATGFIGWRLVPALEAAGWTVVASGRRDRPTTLPASVAYRPADLAADDLGPLVAGVTHVVHLAGASSSLSTQEEMVRSNVDGTRRLVAAAAAAGVERFVHMSSTSVYGEEEQLPLPVREEVEPHPSRGYGKAKWQAEQQVWAAVEAGFDAAVLRPVTVYGPGAVKLLASAILDAAVERHAGLRQLAVAAPPVEQRLVHLDDLVAATLHVLRHPDARGRAFNVASGVYPSSHEVAGILAAEFGMEPEVSDDPECGLPYDERQKVHARMLEQGMEDRILLNTERFRLMRKANRNNRISLDNLLGTGFDLRHTDLAAGVAGTVAWYREHRWLL
jgi:UDP-glucose 4-epimerase